jgi:protein phosphatase
MAHVTLKRGDRILLCSDGLHDYFPVEEEIAQRISAEKPGDALKEMVELAKTRGGHDNITGVAVLVSDLHEGVPSTISSDSTQPVDITGNPFASDEPTQTAAVPPPPQPKPSKLDPGQLKQTQPMRAMPDGEDMGSATTLPPPMNDKKAKADKADADKNADADKKTDGESKAKADAPDDAAPTQPIATADTGPSKIQPESPKKD